MAINDSCQIYEINMRNGKKRIAQRVGDDRHTYSDCFNSGSNNTRRSGKLMAALTAKTAAVTSSRYMSHCQINAAVPSAGNGATIRAAATGDAETVTVMMTAPAMAAAAVSPIMTRTATAMTSASTRTTTLTTAPITATTTTATSPVTTSSDTNTSSSRTPTATASKCIKPINSWQQQRQQCPHHYDCNRYNCCYGFMRQEQQQQRKQQEPNAIVVHCLHEQQQHSSCNNNNNKSHNNNNNYNNGVAAECTVTGIADASVKGVTGTEQQPKQLPGSNLSRKYAKKTVPTTATPPTTTTTPPTTTTTCAFCLNRLTSDGDRDNNSCCWHQLLQRKIATTISAAAAANQHDSNGVVAKCNNKHNNTNNKKNSHLLPKSSTKQCTAIMTPTTCSSCTPPALLCSVLPALRSHLLRKHNWQQLFAVLLLLQLVSGGHMSLVWAAEPPPLELVSVMLATNNNNNSSDSSGLAAKTAIDGNSTSSTIMQGLALALGISASTTTTTTTTTTTMAANKTAVTTKTTTTAAASTLMTTVRQQQPQFGAEEQQLLQQQHKQLLANGNATAAAHPVSSGVIQLINRDAVLQRYNGGVPVSNTPLHNAAAATRNSNANTCRSCQMREKAKLDSLESIKLHILMRLHLTQLPNITAPIPVPHNIIENFYRNYNATLGKRRRAESNAGRRTRGRDNTHASHQLRAQRPQKPPTKKKHQQLAHAAHRRPLAQDSGADDSFSDEAAWHEYSESEEADTADRDVADMLGDDAQRYQHQHPAKPALQSAGFYNLNTDLDGGELYDDDDVEDEIEKDDDDDYISTAFYSRVNSVYIFPTFTRLRHNRKSEMLNFKFEHNHATIVRTVIHLYIRGRDWMHEYEPELLHEPGRPSEETRRHVVVSIHRAVRRPNALNFTHTVKLAETRRKIPTGLGQWVQIEVQQLAAHWTEYRNATLTLVVKCQEPWMRPFVVTGGDGAQHKPLTVHIEVLTKDQRRRKRSTSLDCQESDHEMRCCRYPLKVNFTNFGWHFVVAPTSFDAYFCNGECKIGYLEESPHTHIASLTTSATPCCSPTKMSSLNLLYFDNEQNLVLSTIPNMSVEKCSCS